MEEKLLKIIESVIENLGGPQREILLTVTCDELLEIQKELSGYVVNNNSHKALYGIGGNVITYHLLGFRLHLKIDTDLKAK